VLYVPIGGKSGDIKYMHLDSTVFYGNFIEDFQSYRKLECIVEKSKTGIEHALKVYNPYEFDILLENLKYAISYSNEHKQVKEVQSLKVKNLYPGNRILKAKDTVFYTFELPLPKMENPDYYRIGISENGLSPGLNGKPIKITE
jgi:hypothetical protein